MSDPKIASDFKSTLNAMAAKSKNFSKDLGNAVEALRLRGSKLRDEVERIKYMPVSMD